MKVDKDFVVRIGGNEFADTPTLLAAKGEPVLTVRRADSGELAVELDIYNDKGKAVARVREDKLASGDPDVFEVRVTDNRFTVLDRKKDRVVCEIRRRANARDMDLDVSLLAHLPDGFLVHANPDQTNLRIRSSEEVIRGRDAALNLN